MSPRVDWPVLLRAFPARTLYARPPRLLRPTFAAYLGLAICGFLLLGMAVAMAPALVVDWRMRDTAVPVPGTVRLEPHRCDTRMAVNLCDVRLTMPGPDGRPVRQVLHYFFFSTPGPLSAIVVADPRDPGQVSTDLGLDYFWNRLATLLVSATLLAAGLARIVVGRVRAWRWRARWRRQPMVPVQLDWTAATSDQVAAYWTVQGESGTEQRWTVPSGAKPFVLGPAHVILGLASPDGRTVMPLDDALRWVALTRAERRAVQAAAAAVSRPGPWLSEAPSGRGRTPT